MLAKLLSCPLNIELQNIVCNRIYVYGTSQKHEQARTGKKSIRRRLYVSWSTSELRVRLAPLNRFKPSSKIFYWPFQGGTSFVVLLCFCSVLCWLCFVRVCLYVLCGHLLGKGWPLGSRLWCLLWVCHFPIGILGQVWYLIVSIPDLCNLITLLLSIVVSWVRSGT